ncbi:MAG: hypothetical protein WCX82_01180 [archaeon]|jgi:hypothetical protein
MKKLLTEFSGKKLTNPIFKEKSSRVNELKRQVKSYTPEQIKDLFKQAREQEDPEKFLLSKGIDVRKFANKNNRFSTQNYSPEELVKSNVDLSKFENQKAMAILLDAKSKGESIRNIVKTAHNSKISIEELSRIFSTSEIPDALIEMSKVYEKKDLIRLNTYPVFSGELRPHIVKALQNTGVSKYTITKEIISSMLTAEEVKQYDRILAVRKKISDKKLYGDKKSEAERVELLKQEAKIVSKLKAKLNKGNKENLSHEYMIRPTIDLMKLFGTDITEQLKVYEIANGNLDPKNNYFEIQKLIEIIRPNSSNISEVFDYIDKKYSTATAIKTIFIDISENQKNKNESYALSGTFWQLADKVEVGELVKILYRDCGGHQHTGDLAKLVYEKTHDYSKTAEILDNSFVNSNPESIVRILNSLTNGSGPIIAKYLLEKTDDEKQIIQMMEKLNIDYGSKKGYIKESIAEARKELVVEGKFRKPLFGKARRKE